MRNNKFKSFQSDMPETINYVGYLKSVNNKRTQIEILQSLDESCFDPYLEMTKN